MMPSQVHIKKIEKNSQNSQTIRCRGREKLGNKLKVNYTALPEDEQLSVVYHKKKDKNKTKLERVTSILKYIISNVSSVKVK